MKTTGQLRIFISYSHGGNGPVWKASLLRALHVFELHHLLDVWEDGKIRVSAYWDDDISQAMTSAQLAVVLLTPEALKSMYVIEREFPVLSSRQTHDKLPIIPVICEPCDWKAHDWIRATQAPNASNPLSELTPTQIDRVFRAIATEIAETLSHVALTGISAADAALQPTRVYLDRFPLTRGAGLHHERLIGREQELALLDLAFAQSHPAIVSLVAWGGVGKTMLVQHWLQHLQRQGWFGARRVYAWSFYSQGTTEDRQASEDMFLAHALEWFGVQCEPTLSPWDKGRLLADAVARERTLLILDGIEPLQYPPGPMGGQLRAPGVQSLLKQLARKASSDKSEISNPKSEIANALCLVTTREPLTDLADFQRRPHAAWGSALCVDLGNLTDEAGAALLHHAGANRAGAAEIKADDKELLAASREVDGHALTLNLLGRFLARAHGGDIRRRDLVKFEEADRTVQGGTTFKMLAAFENWFARSGDFGARQLAVLRILGLFDRPADSGCIAALRQPPVIAGLTDPLFTTKLDASTSHATAEPLVEEEWNIPTSFLADFGLVAIQIDADNNKRLLDCHPLIREHFARQRQEKHAESWASAHRRLYEYLCSTTIDKVQACLGDLQPLYQAVAHGCQAGVQQDAADKVYFGRLQRRKERYSTFKLGAIGADLGAVACFFERPWSHVSPLLTEAYQAWMLNEAGYRLAALGRLKEAADPTRKALERLVYDEDWKRSAGVASNLSELNLILGDIAGALASAQQGEAYADRSGDAFLETCSRANIAHALHQAGRRIEADDHFRKAEAMHAANQSAYPMLYSVQGFQYCELLLAAPERAAWQCSLGIQSASSASIQQSEGKMLTNPAAWFAAIEEATRAIEQRATLTRRWAGWHLGLQDVALDHLTLGRAALCAWVLESTNTSSFAGRSRDADGSDTVLLSISMTTLEWGGEIEPEKFDAQQATKEMKEGLPDWRLM